MKKALLIGFIVVLGGCNKQPEKIDAHQTPTKQPEKELTQEERDQAFLDKVAEASTLDEALKLASTQLGNQYQKDDNVSLGANGLV